MIQLEYASSNSVDRSDMYLSNHFLFQRINSIVTKYIDKNQINPIALVN